MSGWNQAPLPRDQILLIPETLGDRIPADHTVRLLAEMLEALDWSSWERHYVLVAGQPPIHPRIVAGAILYGLTLGIRSSRRLEWACGHSVDFLWLVEGRTIDHSTFCGFRTRFQKELRELFRQVGRLAMRLGLLSLNQLGLDGSRVRANSSPSATATAATLKQRLAALDEQVERMLAEADEVDERERDLFGDQVSVTTLPRALGDAKRRQARLRQALAAAERADAQRPNRRRVSKVPVADPESAIMPNKEGGYAPNYNPVAAVDGTSGMIVDADVLNEMREGETVIPTMERVEASFGKKPEQLLADTTFATGANLSALEARRIEAVMPAGPKPLPEDHPVRRADPSEPVAEAHWPALPRRAQSGQLDRSAFVYDEVRDSYWCPSGRELPFLQTKEKGRGTSESSWYRVYRCSSCAGCGLASACLSKGSSRRTVSHDQHDKVRRATAARLATPLGQAAYRRRAHLAETPNAVIKQVMGLRQFLHRGMDKVRTEWLWACTAYNVKKLIQVNVKKLNQATEGLRAEVVLQPA